TLYTCATDIHLYSTSYLILIPRQHNKSTNLPYTTLFRSISVKRRKRNESAEFWFSESGLHISGGVHSDSRRDSGVERQADILRRDRKSTRLNSSHVSISYAVYCLKQTITQMLNKKDLKRI